MLSKQDAHNRSVNIGIAKKYGTNAAFIMFDLIYWLQHNKDEQLNFFDGKTWSYRTYNGWQKHLPFLTRRQIEHAIKQLKKMGVIITREMESSEKNKGIWYALVNEDDYLHGSYPQKEVKQQGGVTHTCATPTHPCATTPLYNINKQKNKKDVFIKKGWSKKDQPRKKPQPTEEETMLRLKNSEIPICQWTNQDKKMGEPGYYCNQMFHRNIQVESESGKRYAMGLCNHHNRVSFELKTFKNANELVKLIE